MEWVGVLAGHGEPTLRDDHFGKEAEEKRSEIRRRMAVISHVVSLQHKPGTNRNCRTERRWKQNEAAPVCM